MFSSIASTEVSLGMDFYQQFYARAVLPQFGIVDVEIIWHDRRVSGPDESVYPFAVAETQYLLIFEDYDGLGRNVDYITNNVVAPGTAFEFALPVSESSVSPSYNGFKLPPPSKYVPEITGTFTLIRLA